MARIVSVLVLVVSVLFLGMLFYQVMAYFLLPLFMAALLVVMFRPVHQLCVKKFPNRPRTSAGATTAAIVLIVVLPLAGLSALAINEGISVVSWFSSHTAEFEGKKVALRQRFHLEIPLSAELQDIDDALVELLAEADDENTRAVEKRAHDRRVKTLKAAREQFYRRYDADKLELQLADIAEERLAFGEASARLFGDVAVKRKKTEAKGDVEAEDGDAVQDEPTPLEEVEPGDLDYLGVVQASQLAFGKMRRTLLGGSIQTWMKDLVSDRRIDQSTTQATEYLQQQLLNITTATTGLIIQFLFGISIMILALYYFLLDGPTMVASAMRLSPLDDRYERQLLEQFDSLSRAVVLATLMSAVAQGLLAGIGFFLTGIESVFLLMMLSMVLALVPFIGAAAVWVPACLWLFVYEERTGAAVFLLIYGAGVISMADNLIKPYVLHGQSNMHPLLALLSVLGGVQSLGPIGILVGPMIVAFLQAVLNMLNSELATMDKSKQPQTPPQKSQKKGSRR